MAAPKKSKPQPHKSPADTSEAVDRFMADLQHPFKAGIQKLRSMILDVDPSIAEGIKWNSPSFRTTEYFATTNLRAKAGVGLVLHLGAKVRGLPTRIAIADPEELLTWLGKDRALVEFTSVRELAVKAPALNAVLRQWIKHV